MKTVALIPAGGAGKRLKSHIAKQYLLLDSLPILIHTLNVFQNSNEIDEIILALPPEDLVYTRQELAEKYGLTKVTDAVAGGNERQDSVRNCLMALEGKCDLVVIHDAVRPFVTEELIKKVVDSARTTGAAIAGVRTKDTIKETREDAVVKATVPRQNLWQAQTPQAFTFDLLKTAYDAAYKENFYGTDDASLVERMGKEVKIIEGSYENIKITTNEDMMIADVLMKKRNKVGFRSGMGYDSHRFAAGRKLILGGVDIPFDKGLQGHSDADALIHAICDALLGASGDGDIGRHFPDNDPEYKNISSMILLERVNKIIKAKRFSINNIDATVVMEQPKLIPHADKMISNIARVLKITKDCVNIKAKTNEGMGFAGRNEGVAVFAVVTLTERKKDDSQA
ncbi:MAG: 2-C-methyl-D-erythritol 4-phosphate cytidylyltransferase [Smithella sp.]|jgi:2-C-methyl-D-erythritol 4-phosphate cytidylyltransferase/2-C-methyl-D-erythritol 2,4-cyclodiphosphate synthase